MKRVKKLKDDGCTESEERPKRERRSPKALEDYVTTYLAAADKFV